MARPILGDLDLEQVQVVETDEDQVVVHHPVPSLDGDFVQPLGRRAARFHLAGVLTAAPTLQTLAQLREQFLAAEPVTFVSDISTATLVDQVLIEQMDVREVAGAPERLEYRFLLREYTAPEPITTETVVVPPTELPPVTHGALVATVVVEGDPAFDFDRVRLSVSGTPDEGPPMGLRTLTNRTADNTWFEEVFPAGDYRVDALVDDTATPSGRREVLTGSGEVRVDNGATASVLIVLRRGATTATMLRIHFRFDSAFVEPCMRPVLADVAAHADANSDQRLLIIGHTDLVGSPEYNQSLSERRGRAAWAVLTAGVDLARSVAEWDELRRARPAGVLPSSRDTWGRREYQQMLAHLGYYHGNIDGDFDLTDAAVRQFQADNGLAPDGDVGDLTWPVLIEQYLAKDVLSVADDRFLPNADEDGCDHGPLRWVGCTEQDPVLQTPLAWRPNRRTEFVFVREAALPCPVQPPVTLTQVPDGAGGAGWCLGGPTDGLACCAVVPHEDECDADQPNRWCRQPADPTTLQVSGRLEFGDGSPAAAQKYFLTAPDGEYLDGEFQDPSPAVLAGTPREGRTDGDGRFAYARDTPSGIHTLEVPGPWVAFHKGAPLEEATGNVVCARLGPGDELVVVLVDRAVAGIRPSIVGPDVVVVDRPHTTPVRQPVTLQVSAPFTGTGTLTRSSDAVRLFDAASGGNELTFDGVDNAFTADQLVAGHQVFAIGAHASNAVGDVVLTLALDVNGTPGLADTHRMTAVLVTVDLHESRTSTTALPPPLDDTAKVGTGRFVHVQDAGSHAGRAMITVRRTMPADFDGDLVIAPIDPRVRLFQAADEVAAAGQAPVATPLVVANGDLPANGRRFWLEGVTVSGGLRDTGVRIGLDGIEPDGDRVALTVVQFSDLAVQVPATPANTPRLGNSPVAAHTFTVGAGPVAADFDEDPTINAPLPLLENCVTSTAPMDVSVAVAPAGVPVSWSTQRAAGLPQASGGDDDPAIVALSPHAQPTITPASNNPLRATLLADAVGTFHVRPFVDGNGDGVFNHGIDREPNLVMNVVMGRATLHQDNSVTRNANFAVTPLGVGGIVVDSGNFSIATPATTAMHLNAQVDVVTGGADGRRAIGQFFGGWVNNVTGPNVSTATYTDATVVPPTVHPAPRVFASNLPANATFMPGGVAPALIAPPILDSGQQSPGTGGLSATLSTSRIRSRAQRPLGERWIVEAVDSPALSAAGTHPGRPAARLTAFAFTPSFRAFLSLWTNTTATIGPTGDPADRTYTVLRTVTWAQVGNFTITPATGAIIQVVAPSTSISGSATSSPAVAAASTNVEVRFPAAVPSLGLDARA